MLVKPHTFCLRSLSKRRIRFPKSQFEPQQRVVREPKSPPFRLFKTESRKKKQKWNGEMGCNQFSRPTCPLKFHGACAKVGRLYAPPANPYRHTTPFISPAHLCPFAGRTRVSARTFIPAFVFAHRPTRASSSRVHPTDYPDIAAFAQDRSDE
jgi:hypothetical protein